MFKRMGLAKGYSVGILTFLVTGTTLFAGCGEGTDKVDVKNDADVALSPANESKGASESDSTGENGNVSATTSGTAGATSSSANTQTNGSSTISTSNVQQSTQSTTSAVSSSKTNSNVSPGDGDQVPYNPATFDQLLSSNVANGRVDYSAFKKSEAFASFLESLASADPSSMSTDGQLAFWINAYNAMVIKNVNDNPGIKQPLDVAGFFEKKTFTVAGKSLTLNDIENNIVRPTFKEPLIHFGLVCAALSCPPLIPKAYTAENVRSLLAENARKYLADTKQNKWDAKTKTLSLSKIFEWYKVDFGDNDAGLIAFAKQYGPESMKSGLEAAGNAKVKFLEYDWTLNKK
ncbi:MAG: DUF547 domain-containing protein [Candidatus Kapaibacterium sp.]